MLPVLSLTSCQEEDEEEWVPNVDYSTYDTDNPAYHVAFLNIDTENEQPVNSQKNKDYRNCHVQMTSEKEEWNTSCTGRIRGRGNSTWKWYDKKPYRLKLDGSLSLLGLPEGTDWVLLANYRDPTDMMNTFVFILGERVGLPFTNHTRYVELTLNGEYMGLYQLTEQVMVGKGRVDIDEETGILLALDLNDGPKMSPKANDNFWSAIYELPVCVKHPDDSTNMQLEPIRQELALLEQTIQAHDLGQLSKLMDVEAYIDFLLIEELVGNKELTGPRSMFIFRDQGGLWTLGPLWDFDAAYGLDWRRMKYSHHFFDDPDLMVMGKNPASHKDSWKFVTGFFTDMWADADFVALVQERWNLLKPHILEDCWTETLKYYQGASNALDRDAIRWPIDKNHKTEIYRMGNWLAERVDYLDKVVSQYSEHTITKP
ncbi:MAG: CotH kinase family protein [Prevotella sp.]|nr:CotH kinase family protein [Prevotella sp.]MBP5508788.1 CotH kinase family protein [Prevotella sp.]